MLGRNKRDDSKYTVVKFRTTQMEKEKLKEYAMLNHLSISEYIREALDIRDEITRNKFGLTGSEEIFEAYFDDFEDEDYY